MLARAAPVVASNSRTVQSMPPEATVAPSAEMATTDTQPEWPSRGPWLSGDLGSKGDGEDDLLNLVEHT